MPQGEYATNVYTTAEWNMMADAGAVFLPASGSVLYDRPGYFTFSDQGDLGYYWSSDEPYASSGEVYNFYFGNDFCLPRVTGYVYRIKQVRLVKNAN